MPIFLTRLISYGGDRLHTSPPSPCRRTLHPWGLSIGTLNIRNGQGYGLMQAIRAVQIDGFDLMILLDNKITNQAYCHSSLGYNVFYSLMSMAAAGGAQGVGCLVVQD